MIYLVQFTGNPDRAEARAALMPDHLLFLERNRSAILVGAVAG